MKRPSIGPALGLAPNGLAQGRQTTKELDSESMSGVVAAFPEAAEMEIKSNCKDQNCPFLRLGMEWARNILWMAPDDREELSALEICSLLLNKAHNVDPQYTAFAQWFREQQAPYDHVRGTSFGNSLEEIG